MPETAEHGFARGENRPKYSYWPISPTSKPDLAALVWDTEVVVDRLTALADLYAAAGLEHAADRAIRHAFGWQKVADVIAGAMVPA